MFCVGADPRKHQSPGMGKIRGLSKQVLGWAAGVVLLGTWEVVDIVRVVPTDNKLCSLKPPHGVFYVRAALGH